MKTVPGAPPKHHGLRIEGEEFIAGHFNPPGQSQLSYRVAVYFTFLEGMLKRLKTQKISHLGGASQTPLSSLNVTDPDGIVVAILRAWAVVGDVLTFYQERIANEGYWRTATERLSMLALVRTIGYEPNPGLAASTHLAFTVAAAPGAPARVVVPAGTAVMSTPAGGQQPQTFETIEPVDASVAWNSVPAYVETAVARQKIFAHATELRLAGDNLRLKPADALLLVGDLQVASSEGPGLTGTWLRFVKTVAPDKAAGYTLVTLEPAAVVADVESPLSNPQVFAFRQRGSLFGFNAPQWNDLAVSIKQKFGTVIGGPFLSSDRGASWRSNNSGLPLTEIRALAIGGDGTCFAGMAGGGVYRLAPDGTRWEPRSSGLTRGDVYSLAVSEQGHVFAGLSGGSVFRSTDNGDTWVAIGRAIVTLKAKEGLQAVDSRLPATVVRSLVTGTEANSGATLLLAGTDNGVFRAHTDLSGWSPCNRGLPNTDAGTGLTSTVVNSLVLSAGGEQWYAGTDHGAFRWSRHKLDLREEWVALNQGLPVDSSGRTVTVLELIACATNEGPSSTEPIKCLMAATARGVFVYHEDAGEWRSANNGLPTLADARAGVATVPVPALASGLDARGTTSFFAGTSQGLYASRNEGASWTRADAALLQMLFALSNPAPQVTDALNQGVISTELRFQFQLRSFALSADACVVSVIEPDRQWQAYDDSLQRTYALRIEGSNLNVYLINTNVRAVAAGSNGKVIAATPPGGIAETEWPDFAVADPRVELETIRKGILPNSYVALSQHGNPPADSSSPPTSPPSLPNEENGAPEVVICKVRDSFITPVSAYTRSATVTAIETDAADTLIGFDRRLTTVFLQSENLPLFEAQIQQPTFVKGSEIVLAGLDQNFEPGRKLVVSGKRARALIVTDLGGVARLSDSKCDPIGPANTDVRALVIDSQNNILAATYNAGLRQYLNALESPEWITIHTGATSLNVTALAVDPVSRNTYAAFAGGELFRARHASGSWTPLELPVTSDVRALAFGPDGRCFAGTDGAGVFRAAADGSWEPVQTGLANLQITSLAIAANGKIFAGTAGGVFRSSDHGNHWQAINHGLANLSIAALVIGPTNKIYAATRGGGIFSLADDSEHWRAVNDGLTNRDVRALAVHLPTGSVFAGASGYGVFRLTAPDSHWKSLDSGVSNDVRALVVAPNGDLFTGTRNAALLTPADGGPLRELRNEPVGFALPAKFQADFDLGIIPSGVQKIFASNNEALAKDAVLTIQRPGRIWLIASGKSDLFLIKNEPIGLGVYKPNYLLEVAASPTATARSGSLRWQLLDSSGEAGSIAARVNEISPGPALPQRPAVGELVVSRATKAELGQRRTIVTVRDPSLANIYDASTVKVYANIAAATHGETIYPSEVLGSGDASQPNQSFVLKKPPLTYIPAEQPGLAQSTLAVSVSTTIQEGTPRFDPGSLTPPRTAGSSVQWVQAETLCGADENRRVYMVRTNDKGQTFVIFGDGIDGARLPSGRENIVASYRSGIGTAGNLDAGQLTLLKTKSVSLRSVTNLTPASGGIDPQPFQTALFVAPLTVRALGRVVSLLDHEDFVRTMPGIGKAKVKALYRANQPLAHITVAAEDGSAIAKDSDYYANLVDTISRFSSSAHEFQVDSYEPLFFKVSAQVTCAGGQDQAVLQAAIEAVISQTFSFANRDFGQDVEASQILTLIQNVSGVVSVSLKALYLAGSSEVLHSRLRAAPARFDPVTQTIFPAQLLLLDSHNPLRLTLETTGETTP